MAIQGDLAMTPAEMESVSPLPMGAAWMSCHFSAEGTGLTDLPRSLPENALLILDDSIPPTGQEPQKILEILKDAVDRLHCGAVLLDFQKTNRTETADLAHALAQGLSCPVGVSQGYAINTDGPVFLPLLPPHKSLRTYLRPWNGREVWLEVGPGAETVVVTEDGAKVLPVPAAVPSYPFSHKGLHCHYGIQPQDRQILFNLSRTQEDLSALIREAESLGVTRTIGLYQELVQLTEQ